jgi:hypothetical protein
MELFKEADSQALRDGDYELVFRCSFSKVIGSRMRPGSMKSPLGERAG